MNLPPSPPIDDKSITQALVGQNTKGAQIPPALLQNIGLLAKVVVLKLPEQVITATARQGNHPPVEFVTDIEQAPQSDAALRIAQTKTPQGTIALLLNTATQTQSFQLSPQALTTLVDKISPTILANIQQHSTVTLQVPSSVTVPPSAIRQSGNEDVTVTITPDRSGRSLIDKPISIKLTLPANVISTLLPPSTSNQPTTLPAENAPTPSGFKLNIQAPTSATPKLEVISDGNTPSTNTRSKADAAPLVLTPRQTLPILNQIVQTVLSQGVPVSQLPKTVAAPLQVNQTPKVPTSTISVATTLAVNQQQVNVARQGIEVVGITNPAKPLDIAPSVPNVPAVVRPLLQPIIEAKLLSISQTPTPETGRASGDTPKTAVGVATPNQTSTQNQTTTPQRSLIPPTAIDKPIGATGDPIPQIQTSSKHQPLPEAMLTQVKQYAKQMLLQSGSTNQALGNILSGLKEAVKTPDKQTQQLSQRIMDSLNLVNSTGDKMPNPVEQSPSEPSLEAQTQVPSSTLIRALLTSAPITSISPNATTSQSNFVNGLVTVFQLALASRAVRQQASLADTAATLTRVLPKGVTTASVPAKTINDIGSIESKYQLEKSAKTLLANFQSSKLQHTESRSAGQENLHFVLPINQHDNNAPELLIQREDDREKEVERGASNTRQWNLTMKLDVGELGEMLVKTAVRQDDIDIDFYTSSDALLSKVYDTLPFLKRRLAALGVGVNSSSCQRGKIPAQLSERPYNIFETMV